MFGRQAKDTALTQTTMWWSWFEIFILKIRYSSIPFFLLKPNCVSLYGNKCSPWFLNFWMSRWKLKWANTSWTNLWHQRTPHQSCPLIPARCSAGTNEWRCGFVMILLVRGRKQDNECVFLSRQNDRQGCAIYRRTQLPLSCSLSLYRIQDWPKEWLCIYTYIYIYIIK